MGANMSDDGVDDGGAIGSVVVFVVGGETDTGGGDVRRGVLLLG